jgi:hypothetical protein
MTSRRRSTSSSRNWRRLLAAAAACLLAIGAGCTPAPVVIGDPFMPTDRANPLAGSWDKTTISPCGEFYPDHLEFKENGIYAGRRDPPGTFTTWDAGKYEIAGTGRVRISTANDAIVAYRFTLAGDVLTFVDDDACRVAYRRAGT